MIKNLKSNEYFVFGSNLAGRHGKGAAKYALDNFGAIYGKAIGIQGKSYAIPTKDMNIKTLPLKDIEYYVSLFLDFAHKNPDKVFLVTEIGCGLAGYKPSDISPFFRRARFMTNVVLPDSF